MKTSLKAGFAQIFSCCPKNLSCPKFGGAAAPLAPPARTPMAANGTKVRLVHVGTGLVLVPSAKTRGKLQMSSTIH